MHVSSVQSSCPCVNISQASARILPHESVLLAVKFDSKEQPDFRGALSVELTGIGEDGETLFHTKVSVTVMPDSLVGAVTVEIITSYRPCHLELA